MYESCGGICGEGWLIWWDVGKPGCDGCAHTRFVVRERVGAHPFGGWLRMSRDLGMWGCDGCVHTRFVVGERVGAHPFRVLFPMSRDVGMVGGGVARMAARVPIPGPENRSPEKGGLCGSRFPRVLAAGSDDGLASLGFCGFSRAPTTGARGLPFPRPSVAGPDAWLASLARLDFFRAAPLRRRGSGKSADGEI